MSLIVKDSGADYDLINYRGQVQKVSEWKFFSMLLKIVL